MRHIRSVLYGVVLAPAIWVLCAVGLGRGDAGRAIKEGFTFETLGGLAMLILAGAAYSFLILPRLSPTGPILAGTLFVAATIWVLVDTVSFNGLWPSAVHRPGFDFTMPSRGLALLLSVPLLATAFSARRWRRFEFPSTTPAPRPSAQPTAVLPNHRPTPTLVASGAAATQYIATDRSAPPPAPTPVPDALPTGETTQIIPTTHGRRLPSSPADATTGGVPAAASSGGMPMPPGEATQVIPTTPVIATTQVIPTTSREPSTEVIPTTQVIPTTSREPSTVRLQPSAAAPSATGSAASAPHADEATLRIVAPTKPTTAEPPTAPALPVGELTTANIGLDGPTAVIRTTRPDESAVAEPTPESRETAEDGPDDQPTTRLRSPADTSGEATMLLSPGGDARGATGEANSSLSSREAHVTEPGTDPAETDPAETDAGETDAGDATRDKSQQE